MTTPTRTVAFLGTGTMGLPMVRNLLAAGLVVRVWNRTRDKADPLVADGATVHDSPAAAAEGADTLVTMLFDLEAVADVAPEALRALRPDAVWLQMSTVGLVGSEQLAALAEKHGVGYVDAPVVGTKAPAEQGALTVLAAAAPGLRERAEPVFDAVGSRTVWVDAPCGGTRLKLVANTWVLALTEGVAESIALAEGLGLDPQLFLDTIKGAPTDAAYAQLKGSAMIARSFDPSFALDAALKDAGLILEAPDQAGLDLAVTEAVRRHLARAAELGHGAEDMAATYYAHQRGTAT
jgi:3-hydroxyisobutyrate dehydrogenase